MPDLPQEIRPTGVIPSSGQVRLRVRYCECDPMGVVHHSVHPIWLEIARTEVLREGGISYREMEAAGVFLVVVHMSLDYRRPGRYDDEIVVKCRVTGTGRAKLEHAYEVWRNVSADGVGGELVAEARTVLACVGADGRPRPLPEWLRAEGHG
jgi:acyl-CoA thioester hydrolase